jgi:hypothetical protein
MPTRDLAALREEHCRLTVLDTTLPSNRLVHRWKDGGGKSL